MPKPRSKRKGHRILVLGQTYSGKTHWVINDFFGDIMDKKYEIIYWLTGSEDDVHDVAKLKHHLAKNGKVKFIVDPTIDTITEIMSTIRMKQKQLEDSGSKLLRICMVFDDLMGERKLFNPHRPSLIEKIFSKGRHDHIDIIVIGQGYSGYFNKSSRNVNPSALVLYNLPPDAINDIVKENCLVNIDQGELTKKIGEAVTPKPDNRYPFMVINKTAFTPETRFVFEGKNFRPTFDNT